MTMKNIFICGGAGFIGSHLTARLLADGAVSVTIYDNLSSGHEEWIPNDSRVTFRKGHAQDFGRLRASMAEAQPDTVFHLAANPDIARAVTEPTIDFDQGTVLTKNVLEAMRVNGVTRLIYFSGSGVYGEPEIMQGAFDEDYGPNCPISTYGASKLACEAMVSAYCHMFGMTARAFRFANVIGPRQTHGVGFDFLRRLRADPTRLRILGDGSQSKSYIHVEDVLNAVMLVAGRLDDELIGDLVRAYDVYNVSTADTLTVTQIAEMACLVNGREARFTTFDYTGGDRGWKGDVPRVRLNCTKIHGLGWRCTRNSKDAMYLALIAMRDEP